MKFFEKKIWNSIADSPVLAAFMTGVYLSFFHITNNITMLDFGSMVMLATAFIVPITFFVFSVMLLSGLLHKNSFVKAVLFFICNVYLLLMLAPRFLQFDYSPFILRLLRKAKVYHDFKVLIYPSVMLLLSSGISFYFFKKKIRIFSLMLGIMSITALLLNISSIISSIDAGHETEINNSLHGVELSQKNNIYFILSDSYSSFTYMDDKQIDSSKFKDYLNGSGFRLYYDVYGNYHSTLQSMMSMLNMEHHYYNVNYKTSEVHATGRRIIAGNNNFVNLLKSNGYYVQYIHTSSYLLLHGSSADYYYPEISFAGGMTVLEQIVEQIISRKMGIRLGILRTWGDGIVSIDTATARKVITNLIDSNMTSTTADRFFQYIHLMRPGHSPPKKVGSCDETEEIKRYSTRIENVNNYLQALIGDIIARDPTAVIILSGDHGPFITNQCKRKEDLSAVSDYRDRCGVITAIRWPEGYDGGYDDRIKTNINIFRYVMASLSEDDTEILKTLKAEDVYIRGRKNILRIIKNGTPLVPPEIYTE